MITRKDFIRNSISAVGATLLGSALAACGDSSGGGGSDGGGSDCTPSPNIGTNHGHTLTVPAADVAAKADKTYDIKGSSPHTHSVTVTAAMFEQLGGTNPNVSITVTSTTTDAHSHSITITCA